ncbi:MAG: 2-isopropylmalate synthase [Epsilonproteobacteria bacterium]|nr:2-isopropylmalate synthase [Campylobacterota bacterium]
MKYNRFKKIKLKNRIWVDSEITKAPIWCSVDLRDGNQALINPMSIEKKLKFFNTLVEIGFKEIEIGFPSASEVEFSFCRRLIEEDLIPDDVTISILTQAREHLIKKSSEALKGAKNVIVHLYNSTSTMQRELVFKKSQEQIIDIALDGVGWIKKYFKDFEGNLRLEYSPESFTQTELDFAVRICNEVVDAWAPKEDEKVIINLPSTVEIATPNIYADQIEWMGRELKKREQIILSIHAHNDRGTAVAAVELALMAGADRVEGTLLGNGERTGNVDILTLALNMQTQGINSKLDFSNIDKIIKTVEFCNEIKTHPRHPYAGDLVYTAFSGSHQDAIKKALEVQKEDKEWRVPYLPIDPKDVGRSYESIIRVNSQSGKGGISYILSENFGYKIPKEMQSDLANEVQKFSESKGGVISEDEIFQVFKKSFLNITKPISLENITISIKDTQAKVSTTYIDDKHTLLMSKEAGGIIEAVSLMIKDMGIDFKIDWYYEHALSHGHDSKAVAYFGIIINGKKYTGAGVAQNISLASINALISAINLGV